MPYRLEPHVAGQLGEATELDPTQDPPRVNTVEYVLDTRDADDLIESFPVYLVSTELAERLNAAELTGFRLAEARVRLSDECLALCEDDSHDEYRWLRVGAAEPGTDAWLDPQHRLCVSDRMMAVLRSSRLDRCDVQRL